MEAPLRTFADSARDVVRIALSTGLVWDAASVAMVGLTANPAPAITVGAPCGDFWKVGLP